MAAPGYKPLLQDSSGPEEDFIPNRIQEKPGVSRGQFSVVVGLLLFSLCLNIVWGDQMLRRTYSFPEPPPSKYVRLQRNIPFAFSHDDFYTNSNRTVAEAAWHEPKMLSWTGLVALSEEYIKSKGLLPAQKWPWDHTKGLYVLNGFHNLHCLDLIRRSVYHGYDHKPLIIPIEHVSHCLNVLREEIMCNADDTPRYTGPLNAETGKKHPTSGIGQQKMCNDWDKLVDFAVENSACYKPVKTEDPDFPIVERYKFCPDGRVLW